jgi:hypothetical protein
MMAQQTRICRGESLEETPSDEMGVLVGVGGVVTVEEDDWMANGMGCRK